MKHFRYTALLFSVALLTPTVVYAEEDGRFYATAIVGIGFLGSQDLTYRDGTINSTAKADFDASFNGGGAVGYRLTDRWRVESELMYRRNDMRDVTLAGIGVSTQGDYASLSIGVSALYDFRPFANDRMSAFVGGGLAFVQEIDIDFEVGGNEVSFETDDLGVQIQFGGRYDLGKLLYLEAGVRYLTLGDVDMAFPADSSRTLEAEYSPLSLTLALGGRF